jgi:hypothetical protein
MITSKQIILKIIEGLDDTKVDLSKDTAKETGDLLGVDWNKIDFDQFYQGLKVEMEHGDVNPKTDLTSITDNSKEGLLITGKIALAHLNELPDYYSKLKKIENESFSNKFNEEVKVQVERAGPNVYLRNVPDAEASAAELQKVMFSPSGVRVYAYDTHVIRIYKKNYNVAINDTVKYHIEKYAKENNWTLV